MSQAAQLATRFTEILSPDRVLADPVSLRLYGYDAGLDEGLPQVVVLPETTEEVVEVVKVCAVRGIPFVPRGAATSLSGGPVPVAGGVVICLARMNQILHIDPANLRAVVQPGVVNLDLQDVLAVQGYFYAPDPASQGVSTLGGNVGENSGGPHCLKYGVTTNHILGLQVVLPNGRVLRTGSEAAHHLGYDLTGLLVGSEGTLGVVTQITCRLMPLPEAVTTMLAIFDDLDEASQAVSDIIADGLIPATLEMMDKPMIQAVEQSMQAGYPLDAEAVLIIEVDGLQVGMNQQIKRVKAACSRHNVRRFQTAQDEAERTWLWRGRKGAFGAVALLAPSKLATDIAVPRTILPQVLHQIMELGQEYNLRICNVFHAGDGNLHPLILFDPSDPGQVQRAKQVDEQLTRLAVEQGGVLTGEHGIGSQKRKFMTLMFTAAELDAMQRIKDVFDPHQLANPGKVLPDAEDFPLAETLAVPAGDFQRGAEQICVYNDEGHWRPYDYEAAAKLLAVASRSGEPLTIRGSGTKSPAASEDAPTISTLSLNRILQLDTENLTATAQAGVRLAELNEALAERGQMVPLRPPYYDRATVGGVLATADSGPQRLLYGTPRDLVTGLQAALPEGRVVRFGRACVKNVSGYALEKLLIGSWGTLGLITEATIRTMPLPESRETLMVTAPAAGDFAELLGALRASFLRPVAVELLNSPASHQPGIDLAADGWVLLIGFNGLAVEVTAQLDLLSGLCEGHGALYQRLPAEGYDYLWREVADLGRYGAQPPMVHLSSPPSAACGLADEIDLIVKAVGRQVLLTAAVNLGIIRMCFPAGEYPSATLADRLHHAAREYSAGFSWLPAHLAEAAQVRPDAAATELCRALKGALDPQGVLPPLPWM